MTAKTATAVALVALLSAAVLVHATRKGRKGRLSVTGRGTLGRPEWMQFFTDEQYETFRGCVRDYFRQRKLSIVEDADCLRVEKDGETSTVGLTNLAQKCNLADEHEWPEIIAEHLGSCLDGTERDAAILAEIGDFGAMRSRLAVRLLHQTVLSEIPEEDQISRRDLEGILSVVVLDLPDTVRTVSPDEAESWGKSTDELFGLALENVPALCTPEVSRYELENGQVFYLLSGDEFYVATYALLLHRFPECVGTHGALVGVPSRHAVISYPIEDLRIVEAVKSLASAAQYMELKGPGSITDNIYWYRDGRFTRLPYEMEGNELNFEPPDEFVEMLNGLGEPED